MKRIEILEEKINKVLPSSWSHAWLVKVGNKFPRVNGLPLVGEYTLQFASNGNLVSPLDPFRFKTLDEVEKYIESQE